MGLLNARNLRKAKSLLDKNRHKVGDVVGKATEQIDKVSKGKTSNVSAKVEEAARKYAAGGVTHSGVHPDAPHDAPNDAHRDAAPTPGDVPDDADARRREAEATIAAANALRDAAEAAARLLDKTSHSPRAEAGQGSDAPVGEPDPTAGDSRDSAG